ncbi:MAG: S8 family serine peptidase [Bacteroidetes bacterium]|nr:S8 family serine peptidase [Bacteroidota bacterium]
MPQYTVITKRLNIRSKVPAQFPDADHIIGEILEGQTFEGNEADITEVPNRNLGKWYKDRNNHFYWGGGVTESLLSNKVKLVPQTDIDKFLSIAKFPPNSLIDWHKNLRLPDSIKNNLGRNISIAVLDTGIDKTHLDLSSNTIFEKDFTNSSFGTSDVIGHGTMMSSFIAAKNFFGDKGISGIAPAAKIVPVKVMYEENDPQDFLSVGKGIDYAVAQKVDIVSMSIGRDQDVPAVASAIKNAAVNKNIVLVASTKQFDQALPLFQFPCNCPEVIPVTAMPADFIAANFNALPSPLIIFPHIRLWGCTIKDSNYYSDDSGSSIATAMLSGIIALILADNPSLKRDKRTLLNELSKYASSIDDAFIDPANNLRFIYKP